MIFSSPCHKQPRVRGFTVIELMLTLVVLAIIVALGAPSLFNFVIQSRMTSQVNELLADVSLARNEAATRGVRVTVCASNNANTGSASCSTSASDWVNGRIVFVDVSGNGVFDTGSDILLKATPQLTGGSTLSLALNSGSLASGSAFTYISFRPYGGMAISGQTSLGGTTTLVSNAVFTLCPVQSGKDGRVLTIAMTGRPSISRQGC